MLSQACNELPNPCTNLAYLQPPIAAQVHAVRCVMLMTTGAIVWDTLSSLHEEYYTILGGGKLTVSSVVYFVSRFTTLAFVVISTTSRVAPIGHCAEYEKASATILAVAVSSSALLFFFRIRAVFHNNRAVIGFYFILWLFVAGTAVASPFSVTGESIGPTRYRSDAGEKKFGFSLLIALLIHDTLVFAAMSYRLLCNSREEPTLRKQLGSFWSYQSLPRITSIILKDNQRYYAMTIGTNLILIAMLYDPWLAPTMRAQLATFNIFITNSMACRIFRNARAAVKSPASRVIIIDTLRSDSEVPVHCQCSAAGGITTRRPLPLVAMHTTYRMLPKAR
ncbi:hypothetical protein FOMPIDRAFT_1111231 [Fomitopsis schrenkii]|uniref:Uncharacterized protein n=1 Tax=Fomitopsis schrenkii TaxID=2126942 RepID=S8G6F8_FOMSC|nr:hypothetical protein FOMPIDRAFT_1111231 [Fomitopsis schrenkii]